MSAIETQLTLAGALITVWLSFLVASTLWLFRRALRRGRQELRVISRKFPLRDRRAIVNGVGALATLSWLAMAVLFVGPLLLTIGPLLLAIAGLDLTFHIVRAGP